MIIVFQVAKNTNNMDNLKPMNLLFCLVEDVVHFFKEPHFAFID